MTPYKIAQMCHEVNRVWCELNGDDSQKSWVEAEDWQRESALAGVQYRLENPNAPDSCQHDQWVADKVAAGWTYGEVKDAAAKTHPCLVSFDLLPPEQQAKDKLFAAVVKALS